MRIWNQLTVWLGGEALYAVHTRFQISTLCVANDKGRSVCEGDSTIISIVRMR